MGAQKLALSIATIVVGLACFVLGTVAIVIPQWGTFRNRVFEERGNFGPWTTCKDIGYGRQTCGVRISMFRPMFVVFAAGVCASVGIVALGLFCLTTLLHVSVAVKGKGPLQQRHVLIAKLLFGVVAALLSLTAVGMFASQGNDLENGYLVEFAFSFYMEVVVSVFTFTLLLLTVSEYVTLRRRTTERTQSGLTQTRWLGTTIGNPGFRDRAPPPANGISMTDSSGRFVSSSIALKYTGGSYGRGGSPRTSITIKKKGGSKKKTRKSGSGRSSWFSNPMPNRGVNGSVNRRRGRGGNGGGSNGGVEGSEDVPVSPHGSSVSVLSSVSTLSTVASIGSSTVASTPSARTMPLRSSLKRSRTTPEGGFANPAYSTSSPTLSRTGSLKKVRIQTQTTDV